MTIATLTDIFSGNTSTNQITVVYIRQDGGVFIEISMGNILKPQVSLYHIVINGYWYILITFMYF
jgi:hypothetical protein